MKLTRSTPLSLLIILVSVTGCMNTPSYSRYTAPSNMRDDAAESAPASGGGETEGKTVAEAPKSASFLEQDTLTGDWGGLRSKLEDNGLTLEFVYTGEVLSNFRGGIKRGEAYFGNLDMTLTLDTEKAGLWKGGTFFAYSLLNHDTDPFTEKFVGDLQTISNIDAPQEFRLYELWYEQSWMDGDFSALVGLHDMNSEFLVTDTGGLFIGSSFGISPDVSANSPVSIFPVAGPAVRLYLKMNDSLDFRVAVYDGDPGDAEKNHNGLRLRLNSKEGALVIGEVGLHRGQEEGASALPGYLKLGAWLHTADFDDTSGGSAHGENYGIYLIADQMLYRENEDQGLRAFVQIGGAPEDRNEVSFFLGAGVTYRGLFNGRDEDELGLAFGHARIGRSLRSADGRDSAETVIELTYKIQITPWFAIQPDLQYVINPGADPALKNAMVGLVRFEISF